MGRTIWFSSSSCSNFPSFLLVLSLICRSSSLVSPVGVLRCPNLYFSHSSFKVSVCVCMCFLRWADDEYPEMTSRFDVEKQIYALPSDLINTTICSLLAYRCGQTNLCNDQQNYLLTAYHCFSCYTHRATVWLPLIRSSTRSFPISCSVQHREAKSTDLAFLTHLDPGRLGLFSEGGGISATVVFVAWSFSILVWIGTPILYAQKRPSTSEFSHVFYTHRTWLFLGDSHTPSAGWLSKRLLKFQCWVWFR